MEDKIRQIKRQLRLAMNGIVSTSMREKGAEYKLNFGLTYPLLKRIAGSCVPSATLAGRLWTEDIRECRILATLLYPADEFTPDTADEWVVRITQPEIADYCCANLFDRLSFASDKALLWIVSDRELIQYTGFQLFTRLFMRGYKVSGAESIALIDGAKTAVAGLSARVAVAALNCLKRGMRSDKEFSENVLSAFKVADAEGAVYADLLAEHELMY